MADETNQAMTIKGRKNISAVMHHGTRGPSKLSQFGKPNWLICWKLPPGSNQSLIYHIFSDEWCHSSVNHPVILALVDRVANFSKFIFYCI